MSEAQGLSVLVVDDDEDTSALLGIRLRRDGWMATFVTDLSHAQRALATGNFAALVTDLSLPDGSGLSLLSSGRPPSLRAAVVITGSSDDADRRESAQSGFDAHLVKPFDAAELGRLLSRLIGLGGTNPGGEPAELAQDLHESRVEDTP